MRRFTDILVTSVAPLVWGTNFLLTTDFLPAGRPLLDSLVRSLPIGLLIIAFSRQLPKGDWWWKSAVLALLNFGLFFPLLFLAAYHLPGSLASMIGASQPVFIIGLTWGILKQRPIAQTVAAAICVLIGLVLLLGPSAHGIDMTGALAAFAATGIMAIASILLNKWGSPAPPLVLAGWQLAMGGLMLLPFAFLEGPVPQLGTGAILGYLYLGLIGTALAYACWFRGVERLSPVASSLIATLNPIIAIALGLAFNHEHLSLLQGVGVVLTLGAIGLGQTGNAVETETAGTRRPTVHRARRLRAFLRSDITNQFYDKLRRRQLAGVTVGDIELLRAEEPMVRERQVRALADTVTTTVGRRRIADDAT